MISGDRKIKIIDFGFSHFDLRETQLIKRFAGSPTYMAPEMISCTPFDGTVY